MENDLKIRDQLITHEMFRTIFEESPIGIELFDSEGALVDLNRACVGIFGIVDTREMKGVRLFDDPNITGEIRERLLKGETARYEIPYDFEKVRALRSYRTAKSGTIHIDVLIRKSPRTGSWLSMQRVK